MGAPRYEVELLDDWKGVIDPQKRRTLQNRLNQRAHTSPLRLNSTPRPGKSSTSALAKRPNTHTHAITALLPTLNTLSILGPHAKTSKQILQQMESLLFDEFAASSPRTDLLLSLTRVNFLRALHTNIEVLGYSASEMHDDALSQFGSFGPTKPSLRSVESPSFPASLRPTEIQLAIPHHPWVDLLPIPTMRDNLILAEWELGDAFDDTALCRAMCGYGTLSLPARRDVGRGETGIIIWRDPWDASGWEVTETFLRQWGWVVQGCTELFRSTDWWRGVRGERPLFRPDLQS
ncbi:hypothetical protein BDW74DRAFT_171841 [Aspergillus multicolor]|uniref:DUF3425 domain-containing protein n=1 Tax=Aspergillus multicolor TaxID=41759 RepID=UPI003CCDE151